MGALIYIALYIVVGFVTTAVAHEHDGSYFWSRWALWPLYLLGRVIASLH